MKIGGIMSTDMYNHELYGTGEPGWWATCGFEMVRSQLRPEGYWVTVKLNDTKWAEWSIADHHGQDLVRYACHGKDDMEGCEFFCVVFNHAENRFEAVG